MKYSKTVLFTLHVKHSMLLMFTVVDSCIVNFFPENLERISKYASEFLIHAADVEVNVTCLLHFQLHYCILEVLNNIKFYL